MLSLSVLSHPSRAARSPGAPGSKGSRPTPLTPPPSQGGERDRSLATSFHRALQKHASRNRPSSAVNTNFAPVQCGSGSYYGLNSSNRTMRRSVPAVRTASQRAIVPRLSRPEMSGSAPVSRAQNNPAMVPAKASGNQASGHRGRCQDAPDIPAPRKDAPDHRWLLGGRDRDVDDRDRRFLQHRLERRKNACNPPCIGDLARTVLRSRGDSHHREPGLGIGHKMTVADDESRTHHADSHVAMSRP